MSFTALSTETRDLNAPGTRRWGNATHKLSRKVKMETEENLPPTHYLLTDRQGNRAGENGVTMAGMETLHQMTELETRHPAQDHKCSA